MKNKIYREIVVINKGIHVYEPESFRQFCITAGFTKLFDTVLSAITSARHSSERIILNKKRVVSFIYNMCYCLSQACNPLQIDHSLYPRSSRINQKGLDTEHIMGLSCARRTVNSIVNTMAENHYQSFQNFIQDAVKNKWLLVLRANVSKGRESPDRTKKSNSILLYQKIPLGG